MNKTLLFKSMGLEIAQDFNDSIRKLLVGEDGEPTVTQDKYLESWDNDALTIGDMMHLVALTTGQHVHILACTGDAYKWAARFERQGHITAIAYSLTLDKAMALLVIEAADKLGKKK